MNKIATYLNEHLLGEVSTAKAVRSYLSDDGGILSITPDMVILPRVTNDIRKVMRFAWQLAEKGHVLALTVRGNGTDPTGAGIGKGIVISNAAHLNRILDVLPKEKLVHIQSGVEAGALIEMLKWHGLFLPGLPKSVRRSTVGGLIANNSAGQAGYMVDAIEKMEVILSNGDVLETGRISKREVNKRQGEQTLEGEIYRKLEGLIEDNDGLIQKLAQQQSKNNVGYHAITKVRHKDGSFDLTPLIAGSQGTLGIISEVVLNTEFYNPDDVQAVVAAKDVAQAQEIAEALHKLGPAVLEVYDGELFRQAARAGVRFEVLGDVEEVGAVIYLRFTDFSDYARKSKLRRLQKALNSYKLTAIDSSDRNRDEFLPITQISAILETSDDKATFLPILQGITVTPDNRADVHTAIAEIAAKHHMPLPTEENILTGVINVYPALKISSVSEKQKLFKLMNDIAAAVDKAGGAFVGDGAEGRLKANAAWAQLDPDIAELYTKIREIFDPFGILNPGVKQKNELKKLVSALQTNYEPTGLL